MVGRSTIRFSNFTGALLIAVATCGGLRAATKPIDLDANAANGSESQCDLNVLQTFPVMIENTVTNRTVGNAFTFVWASAGPGGFTSSVTAGTAGGVGARWVWTTNQTVFSYTGNACGNDVCFSKTAGPDALGGTCSLCTDDGIVVGVDRGAGAGQAALSWLGGQGTYTVYRAANARTIEDAANAVTTTDLLQFTDTPPTGTIVFYKVRGTSCLLRKPCATNADCIASTDGTCVNRGPFGVPGRSLFSNNVTVSAASLTSSLITFFSPGTNVFTATSTAAPGGVVETVTNSGGGAVTLTVPAYPPGCCPPDGKVLHQLRCGDHCVDYFNDNDNCGACGNVCPEGYSCSEGICAPPCPEGLTACGELCVDTSWDDNNCGVCGNVCPESYCCQWGVCIPPCTEPEVYCNGACVDPQNDSTSCGSCGNACPTGSCCQGGECTSLSCEGEGFPGPHYWYLCGDYCAQLIHDDNNCGECGHACTEGTCCNGEGSCNPGCYEGTTHCGDECVTTSSDPNNCGGCGPDFACEPWECCNGEGGCVDACKSSEETVCDDFCTNTDTDPENCGACGKACDYYQSCCGGECQYECPGGEAKPYPSACGEQVPPEPYNCPEQNGTLPAVCPNPDASSPGATQCDTALVASHRLAGRPNPGLPNVETVRQVLEDTPVCTVPESTQTIESGHSTTTCIPGGTLFKEVPTAITVCGDGIPGVDGQCGTSGTRATTGTFNRLVADPEIPVGNAYVTPFRVIVVADPSQDGLLEPGETATVVIEALNAGPMDITNATATLSAPEVDLSGDGIDNPVGLNIDSDPVSYGTIFGTPVGANCAPSPLQPASNSPAFVVTVPPGHPGDTSHPAVLSVSGIVNGETFAMDVPLTLGIAGGCDPAAHTRDFDNLYGLFAPMALLVPAGETAPLPPYSFEAGKNRTLRLRTNCGVRSLSDAEVDAPEIVALSEAGRGPLDVSTLYDDSRHAFTRFFAWHEHFDDQEREDNSWEYILRTSNLGTGTFTITIRIAGRKDYVSRFVLD